MRHRDSTVPERSGVALSFRRRHVIIVAIVALVIVGIGTGLGDKIKGIFEQVSDALPAAT
ncbi:hypothetical protein [Pseudomonas lactis]|uniref:hypothetical protein n=1 Tax=Pseudomonas lactis TaxID=1615674 RepID=UPI001EE1FB68|nr:hypothetical protein [Pseudomonas lactis]